jgi:glycerophosphoryl diester phosphodiesterase
MSATSSDWKTPHLPWIVGHRGAPGRARENTIDSLDAAESLHADAVEFDLRQTRDGEAVLFHDEDIVLGSQRLPIRTFTTREIGRLSLPSEFGPYRIPRLEDVFHRYGHALRYVVDVKISAHTQSALMARRVARVAAEYGVRNRCLVASFDAEFLRKMRDADPEIATSFLIDHPVALPESGRLTPLFPPVDAIGPRHDLVTEILLSQAAGAGLSVHPWTADEPDEIRRLLALHVPSLTTNVPGLALTIRAELQAGAPGSKDAAAESSSPALEAV